ncbi:MAG: HAD-IC family P-type ATPase [Myxococcota bacterium]|nr:HAD-IC family P-type ATPase [Myxococcota bacterium]
MASTDTFALELSIDEARHARAQRSIGTAEGTIDREALGLDHVPALRRLQFSIGGLASPRDALRLQRRIERLEGVLDAKAFFEDRSLSVTIADNKLDADVIIWIAQTSGCAAVPLEPDVLRDVRAGVDMHRVIKRRGLLVGLPALLVAASSLLTQDLALGNTFVRELVVDAQIFVAGLVFWFGRSVLTHGISLQSWRSAAREAPFAAAAIISAGYGLWAFFSQQDPQFDVPVVIVAGYHVGIWMQSVFVLRAQSSLEDLRAVWPQVATVRRAGRHYTVPIDTLRVDDLVVIGRGDTIPVDGSIIETLSESVIVDESVVLGDGVRCQKNQGGRVLAGTRVDDGAALIRPDRWGQDSVLGTMLNVASGAALSKGTSQIRGDRFAAILAPFGVLAAIATFTVWNQTLPNAPIWTALSPALAVLLLLSPWALGWATVIPTLCAMTRGVRDGVVFRDASSLDMTRSLDVMMIEKAGTLTVGRPEVESFEVYGKVPEKDAARLLRAVEGQSSHAIANAIRAFLKDVETDVFDLDTVTSFREIPGGGVIAQVMGSEVVFGAVHLLQEKGISVEDSVATPQGLYLAVDGEVYARLTLFDPLREDALRMVQAIKKRGIRALILTSSSRGDVSRLATSVGLEPDDVRAGIDSENHAQAVRAIQGAGRRVGLVGQANEDRDALKQADVAIATYDAGAEILANSGNIDTDFSLLALRPGGNGVSAALALADVTHRRVRENFVMASLLMAGGLFAALGWLGPSSAVAVTLLSLYLVGTNGLRAT